MVDEVFFFSFLMGCVGCAGVLVLVGVGWLVGWVGWVGFGLVLVDWWLVGWLFGRLVVW